MISYKPLIKSDIPIIVALMQHFYAIDNYPMDTEISTQLFKVFIADENLGKAWLILENNHIVGYLILTYAFSFEYKGRIAFLDEMYIVENARGKGIGNQVILFVQEECSKLSINLIYLEVEPHNNIAQKLYLSNHFDMHNRLLMKYKS